VCGQVAGYRCAATSQLGRGRFKRLYKIESKKVTVFQAGWNTAGMVVHAENSNRMHLPIIGILVPLFGLLEVGKQGWPFAENLAKIVTKE
jgi:hypothetical protein